MGLPPASRLSLPLTFTCPWGWGTLGSWCSLVALGAGKNRIAPLPCLGAQGLLQASWVLEGRAGGGSNFPEAPCGPAQSQSPHQ